MLNGFRNICARDGRLYCAKVEGANLAEMAGLLLNVLSEGEVMEYVREMIKLWRSYEKSIRRVSFEEMFVGMGFAMVGHP